MEDIVTQQQRQIRQLQKDVERLKTIECGGGGGGGTQAYCAQVHRSTDQVIAADSYDWVIFDTIDYDNHNFFDIASPDRLTVTVDGLYAIGAQIWWTIENSGTRRLLVCVTHGASTLDVAIDAIYWQHNWEVQQSAHTHYRLSAGDYVSVLVSTSGSVNPVNLLAPINNNPGARLYITRLMDAPSGGPGPVPLHGSYMGLLSPITKP